MYRTVLLLLTACHRPPIGDLPTDGLDTGEPPKGPEFVWDGAHDGDQAGASIALVGDTDGDHLADYVVGAPGSDVGGDDGGVAYLIRGPLGLDLDLDRADSQIVGLKDGGAGGWVSTAGDVDGDGFADVVVATTGNRDTNWTANIHRGRLPEMVLADVAWASVQVPSCGVTGKGVSLRNATGGEDLWLCSPGCGAAYLLTNPFPGRYDIQQVAHVSMFGPRLVGLGDASDGGDLTGDGVEDLLLGAPGAAAVYVVVGPFDQVPEGLDPPLVSGSGGRLGAALVAGDDLDGDGYGDLAVGQPDAEGGAGALRIVPGPVKPPSTLFVAEQQPSWVGATAGAAVGSAIASIGDVDGDGGVDLAVAAPGERTVTVVHVVLGVPTPADVLSSDVAAGTLLPVDAVEGRVLLAADPSAGGGRILALTLPGE